MDFDKWKFTNGFEKIIAWDPARRIPLDVPRRGRTTSNPRLPLESWFKKEGGVRREPATGNRKLRDFVNENQLGAVITLWHNAVHGTIGGDMSRTDRAPADPMFWCFHKFIDNVYATWKDIAR